MKARFFGSPFCKDCLELFVFLNKNQIEYEYIDINNDDQKIQSLCDEHFVDEVPHLQLLDDTNNIVIEHIGRIKEEELVAYLTTYFPNY